MVSQSNGQFFSIWRDTSISIKQDITQINISWRTNQKHLPGTLPRNQLPASHHRGACLLGCPSLAVLNCTERWLEGTVPWLIQKLPTGVFQVDGLHPKWLFLHQKLHHWFRFFFLPSGKPCFFFDPNLIFGNSPKISLTWFLEAFSLSRWILPGWSRRTPVKLKGPPPSQGRHEHVQK